MVFDLTEKTGCHLKSSWWEKWFKAMRIDTCAIVQWLLSNIDEMTIGLERMDGENIQRHAPQWMARNRSTNDGSNVKGVERNKQSFDWTSNIDLENQKMVCDYLYQEKTLLQLIKIG